MSDLPGRTCPIRYHYGSQAIASAPMRSADVLYVIGGLYGNVYALKAIQEMIAAEAASGAQVKACFNGDFNWFNVSDQDFVEINRIVAQHDAILGNVEAELASNDLSVGCGCAYPDDVSDIVVERSNRIFERLHRTALQYDSIRQHFASLPMFARYQVGQSLIGIVHGDYESLAGWRFDASALNRTEVHSERMLQAFSQAGVEVFASSHTCLPALKTFVELRNSNAFCKAVINNGAAGMPNFEDTNYGVVTRISLTPSTTHLLYSIRLGELHVEALRVDFDHRAWQEHFLKTWPQGSDAYESYFERIRKGPAYRLEQACKLSHERGAKAQVLSAPVAPQAPISVSAPLAHLKGTRPTAPLWFDQALAMAPRRNFCSVQDANIETLTWGTPGRPGVLLMHGNSAHADWYSYIAPLLADEYYVVALSFSGMGGSSWREQYSVAQWADEALAVAQFTGLFNCAVKPVFVGHSFGGFPVMNAASRFGERLRLAVIADTPIRTREERGQRLDERPRPDFRPHRIYPSADEAIARFRLLPPQTCENLYILDHIARTSLRPAPAGSGQASGWTWKFDPDLFRSFKMGKPGADLLKSLCPVAWLNGAHSALIDDQVRANIKTYSPPGTVVFEVPDADHHLMIDQPLAFTEALRDILSRY